MTRIIVFTGSRGYRHGSTEAGAEAVRQVAGDAGLDAQVTGDPAVFSDAELAAASAVVWMQTSGTGNLDPDQRAAYERFTRAGGGFVGVHAASDGERDWPLYSRLVGARFAAHPAGMHPAIILRQEDHPSVDAVPERWAWTEEWYSFDTPPVGHRVLLALDPASYDMGDLAMADPHPLAWTGELGPARSWYTALGHDSAAFEDPVFRRHLEYGITSVLRSPDASRTL